MAILIVRIQICLALLLLITPSWRFQCHALLPHCGKLTLLRPNLSHADHVQHKKVAGLTPTVLAAYPRSGGQKSRSGSSNLASKLTELSATNFFIYLNVLAFLATSLQPALRNRFMKLDAYIRHGQSYRLFTSLFLHGSLQHLLMNCYSLYQVGPQVERAFGSVRFASTYLLAGILANCATFLLKTSPASLGASGSTFGIIGALAVHFYRNKSILGLRAEAGLEAIKRTVMVNLLYGFAIQGIDNAAHVGETVVSWGLCAGTRWRMGLWLIHTCRSISNPLH